MTAYVNREMVKLAVRRESSAALDSLGANLMTATPNEPGSYKRARGILAPADEPAEVSIRRMRDADTLTDQRTRPREWRPTDQTTATDDTGIIAALRADNVELRRKLSRADQNIADLRGENCQLREQLTALQERGR